MSPRDTVAAAEVDLIVSAVPTPVLVTDYTPIIARFEGITSDALRNLLANDEKALAEALSLPRTIAASSEWVRLYGSPFSNEAPDLIDRHFTREAYPDLYETLISQFTAPFAGTTSILSEHTAPTLFGDVEVRSHWKALVADDRPLWDRIVIVDFDITDLRQTQRALEDLLEIKDELAKSKDQLIASVSHEIRTPLSSIVGFAHLLGETSDLAPEERREMVELLVQESADLTNIVDDLLVAAKSDLGRLEVSIVPVDLRAQAAQAIESLEGEVVHRVIRVPGESTRCLGDPARVRQIIRNLISNGFKYGGPEITIEAEASDDAGLLRVCDNGPGISDDLQQRIFDPYERGNQPKGVTHSLGLGLHISRNLARRMGGDLTYRYEKGRSVFELSLPLAGQSPTG